MEELLTQVSRLHRPEELFRHATEGLEGLFRPTFCGAFELSGREFRLAATAGSAPLPGALVVPSLEGYLATRVGSILAGRSRRNSQ